MFSENFCPACDSVVDSTDMDNWAYKKCEQK